VFETEKGAVPGQDIDKMSSQSAVQNGTDSLTSSSLEGESEVQSWPLVFMNLLIEAGPDSNKTALEPIVASPTAVYGLRTSELDWNYATEPQEHLDGLSLYARRGKGLGGGSMINFDTV
jgi:hypothetical protein